MSRKILDYAMSGPVPYALAGGLGGALSGDEQGRARRALYGAAGGAAGGVALEQTLKHLVKQPMTLHALLGGGRLKQLGEATDKALPGSGKLTEKLRAASEKFKGHEDRKAKVREYLLKRIEKDKGSRALIQDLSGRLDKADRMGGYAAAAGGAIGSTIGANEGLLRLKKKQDTEAAERALYGEMS